MANPVYSAAQVTVGTSATLIATPGSANRMVLTNGAAAIAVGGTTGVTLGNGYPIAANVTNLELPVAAGQSTPLYAICGTSSVVSVLYVT